MFINRAGLYPAAQTLILNTRTILLENLALKLIRILKI